MSSPPRRHASAAAFARWGPWGPTKRAFLVAQAEGPLPPGPVPNSFSFDVVVFPRLEFQFFSIFFGSPGFFLYALRKYLFCGSISIRGVWEGLGPEAQKHRILARF